MCILVIILVFSFSFVRTMNIETEKLSPHQCKLLLGDHAPLFSIDYLDDASYKRSFLVDRDLYTSIRSYTQTTIKKRLQELEAAVEVEYYYAGGQFAKPVYKKLLLMQQDANYNPDKRLTVEQLIVYVRHMGLNRDSAHYIASLYKELPKDKRYKVVRIPEQIMATCLLWNNRVEKFEDCTKRRKSYDYNSHPLIFTKNSSIAIFTLVKDKYSSLPRIFFYEEKMSGNKRLKK